MLCDDALADFSFTANLAEMDTADFESLLAATRRRNVARSSQSKGEQLQDAYAEEVFRSIRRHAPLLKAKVPLVGRKFHRDAPASEAYNRKRGGGGLARICEARAVLQRYFL